MREANREHGTESERMTSGKQIKEQARRDDAMRARSQEASKKHKTEGE